jgi:hypothetical protein
VRRLFTVSCDGTAHDPLSFFKTKELQMRFLSLILFATLSFVSNAVPQASNAPSQAVDVTISPRQPYVERGKSEQSLSFDFLLNNTTETTLLVNKIQLSVLTRTTSWCCESLPAAE